jgi:outer membrane protein assembly factor BamB
MAGFQETSPMRLLIPVGLCALAALTASAGDWSFWRGPTQNGVSAETGLPGEWSPEGKNLLWKREDAGCRSTPLVLNNRVYLINRAGEGTHLQERVMALDLETGATVWEHRFNAFFTDIVAIRLGWANPAADPATGNLYTHGAQGFFTAFDKDGKILWQRSLTEEFGRVSGYGGRSISPIVDGDLVIFSSIFSGWGPHGRAAHRFVAFDKHTGEIRWWSDPGERPNDTCYSTPVVATLDGQRVLIGGIGDGSLVCLRVHTGEKVWRLPLTKTAINVSPVIADGKVYVTHSEENLDSTLMGRVTCVDARTGKEIWHFEGLEAGYASPILHDGMLFVADNSANLFCLDATSGSRLWMYNYGKRGMGSPVLADNKVYVMDGEGVARILEVSRAGCSALSQVEFRRPNGSPREAFATPAVAHGKVIFSNIDELYCISLKPADYRHDEAPAPAPELPPRGDTTLVQVVPADVNALPGQKVKFRLQGFDALGNPTGLQPAAWTLQRVAGQIDKDGVFSTGESRAQAGQVEAVAGALKASARLRMAPALPYLEDFEHIAVSNSPPGWITSPLKSHVVEMGGGKVLRKLAENPAPPFARLMAYTMPPIASGYTVQCDLLGQDKRKLFIPDMGLLNSRYTLMLTGSSTRERQLRLVTWDAIPRLIKEVPFPWLPNHWYTMRFEVTPARDATGTVAHVRGKVWPKGTPEPAAWSIELTDPCPNLEGSPGLYAFSQGITAKSPGTEVFFDNLSVTATQE